MAPLAVDPAALDSAGGAVVAAGAGLGAVISSLTAALAGCAGMAGDDPAGAVFGRSYDGSAAALVQAMSVARNGLCNLGDGVRMSAHNYSLAEAMSDVAGRAAPLPAPPPSGCVGVGAPPSAVGGGGGAPKGWGWVAPYIGMIWPNGDSTKLRAAAVAWRSAGTQFALTEIQSTAGPMGVIRAQQLPEAGLIESAFADAYASTTAVVGQCHQLAAQLDAYAARIDAVHAAVLDLLARICDPLTGIEKYEIKKGAFNTAADAIDYLRSRLTGIAGEGNKEIDDVLASKKPLPEQLAEIQAIQTRCNADAANASRDAVDKVMTAMQEILEAEDIGDDPRTWARANGFNVDDAPPPRLIRENDLAALTGPGARGGSFGSVEGAGDLASPQSVGAGGFSGSGVQAACSQPAPRAIGASSRHASAGPVPPAPVVTTPAAATPPVIATGPRWRCPAGRCRRRPSDRAYRLRRLGNRLRPGW